VLTGGFAFYPMAEVLSVFDQAAKSVDGQMTLAPNNVAWAANDPVEEPHYYQEMVSADIEYVGQTVPRPSVEMRAGLQYQQNNGPGLTGWSIENAAPSSNYLGYGGTHGVPDGAYEATGIWNRTMNLTAGEDAVFAINCNMHGCGNWNSGYNLFELNSNVSVDLVSYSPTTSSLSIGLRGSAPYSFTPQAFTAGTINVGTLNATTLNGAVNGASINSGTISAAHLPLFGPSGNTHAPGIVPDPGSTAGSTRFLREDGVWMVPSGGSGSSGGVQIGGDIGGTNAAPVVTGIQGKAIAATPPTNAQVLIWNTGLSEYVPGPVVAAPAVAVEFYPAAVSDGGTTFAAAWTRYDNNEPQTGSINPAASAQGYMAYQATPVQPQYAELTVSEPGYWTGTGISLDFFSAATTGNVTWEVQAVCIPAGTALTSSYSPTFSMPVAITTAVSGTASGLVTTATVSNLIAPGVGSCPSSPTTPTKVTFRVYRAASDTAAGNANFLGATLLTGRSQ
jgi:hypothetical protein